MTRSRRHIIPRRVRTLLCNPLATVLLLAILAFDAYRLPWHDVLGGRSFAGVLVHRALLGESILSHPAVVHAHFIRDPSGLRMSFPEVESWDEMSRLLSDSPQRVFVLSYRLSTERRGAWALTSEVERRGIIFSDFGAPPTLEERNAAASMLADRLDSEADPRWAAGFRQGPGEVSSPLWSGYLHNTLSLAAFIALLYSVQWIPKTPAWFRDRRRRRAESRGQCPRCGYSLRGLTPDATCPECGRTPATPDAAPSTL